MVKDRVQKFGKFLSGMVMPNIGAFIAWGLITALFIDTGWLPNASLSTLVSPMLTYLLPILIGFTGGKMIAGERGGVIAAVATAGVIVGAPTIPMFIGAMAMGPLAGLVIKLFDKAVDGKIPAGFEMLVNNFSIGILGMLCAIFGFYAIGPIVVTITMVLKSGVEIVITHGLLPLVAIFVEPAKILFLNNALNHGIFGPIGLEQAQETGKSIMFLLETNPGPGVGVLLAYCVFAKGSVKQSAPGAVIIHFFGGIHEIYFPYILMNPLLIIAPILGSAAGIVVFSMLGAGLVATPSPGSILALSALAPKGELLIVLAGVLVSAAVSFVVAMPIVKRAADRENQDLDAAQSKMKDMKAMKPISLDSNKEIKKIIFACDAGMGSSAMGATKFRNRIKGLSIGITVSNTSVDNIPTDTDLVVCHVNLAERALKSAPNAEQINILNFLQDTNLDALYDRLQNRAKEKTTSNASSEVTPEVTPEVISETTKKQSGILKENNILLNLPRMSKEEAIQKAGELLYREGYVNKNYILAMQKREELTTTYMGMGIAIPHGTNDAKEEVLKTGIVVLQYPSGVDFGEEDAQLVIGIAGVGDEHLEVLANISTVLDDEDVLEMLKTTNSKTDILKAFC